jgi:isopenicillin N synthase-like dioxygenase
LSGWSHGKEALKNGTYDTLKGSFYVNCAFYQGQDVTVEQSADFPEFTAPNVWPQESSLPGFRETFEELCILIIDSAVLVARACDRYATENIESYEPNYLERIVKSSTTTKARLLHYYPPDPSSTKVATSNPPHPTFSDHDSWCATHIDHGCLTGLTSALYIDEAANPPQLRRSASKAPSQPLPVLPNLTACPNPSTGLYVHARDSTITKVTIPYDCLAFQTGEALQIITGGKFRAVPHFVRAGRVDERNMGVARNTLAIFTQPGISELVNKKDGTTFGQFSREVMGRFG